MVHETMVFLIQWFNSPLIRPYWGGGSFAGVPQIPMKEVAGLVVWLLFFGSRFGVDEVGCLVYQVVTYHTLKTIWWLAKIKIKLSKHTGCSFT